MYGRLRASLANGEGRLDRARSSQPGAARGRKQGWQICYHRPERTACMELRRFFDQTIQASFHDLAMGGDPVAGYLADLLTRFARTEQLYPPGRAVPRLETVVDML